MRRQLMERVVRELASYERGSASEGERRAAEWLAGELREAGCDARIEEERAHGGYWWPLGILNGIAALCGLGARRHHVGRAQRMVAAVVGAVAAAAIWDELDGGGQRFRRWFLPMR